MENNAMDKDKLKIESFKSVYKRLAALIVFASLLFLFAYNWYQTFNELRGENRFEGKGNWLMIAIYAVGLFMLICAMDGFRIGYNKAGSLVFSQTLSIVLANFAFWVLIVLMIGDIWHIRQTGLAILELTLEQFVGSLVLTNIFSWGYHRLFPPYHMLLISGDYQNALSQKVDARSDKYQIYEEISVYAPNLWEKIMEYDAVLLNDVPSKEKNDIIKQCFQKGVRLYFTPKISDIIVKGTDEVDLFDSPLFLCKNVGPTLEQRFVKRIFDFIFSLLALIILSPFMLIAAIAIKCCDGGSVFYTQKRCTRNGKVFDIYKFRSMIENAEEDGKSRPAVNDDDRITPVGRILRKTRMDELPQLINILIGDMSFVGPRPERVEHVEKYTEEIPEFAFRLKVKGGLTGYAQVYGKYNTTAYDKLKMDLKYITSYSFMLDMQIILRTIKVVFMKESTEGFPQGRK